MNITRRRKLLMVLVIVAGAGVAMGLVLTALNQNINLFYSPTQVIEGIAPQDKVFRLGGLVRPGSIKHASEDLKVTFLLTDTANDINVSFKGILPDLFREGQGIVALGRLNTHGEFVADQVLAKHDENYMPPEVKDAIENVKRVKI